MRRESDRKKTGNCRDTGVNSSTTHVLRCTAGTLRELAGLQRPVPGLPKGTQAEAKRKQRISEDKPGPGPQVVRACRKIKTHHAPRATPGAAGCSSNMNFALRCVTGKRREERRQQLLGHRCPSGYLVSSRRLPVPFPSHTALQTSYGICSRQPRELLWGRDVVCFFCARIIFGCLDQACPRLCVATRPEAQGLGGFIPAVSVSLTISYQKSRRKLLTISYSNQ